MTCFLCGNKTFIKKYSLPDSIIVACKSCGVFIKQTKEQSVDKLYDENYYDSYPYSNAFSLNNRYFEAKITTIQKLTAKRDPLILDIGCGWGDFLTKCQERGLPCFGIDHSPVAIKKCKEKKLNVSNETIEQLILQKKSFDAIVSFQTVEHVKNPIFFLKSARQLLNQKGIILLTTPNNNSPIRFLTRGKWSVYNTDSHYTFFNQKTLQQTLEKSGFTDIKIRLDPPRFFSPRYILSRLLSPPKNKPHGEDGYFERLGMSRREGPTGAKNMSSNRRFDFLTLPIPTDPFGDFEAFAFKT